MQNITAKGQMQVTVIDYSEEDETVLLSVPTFDSDEVEGCVNNDIDVEDFDMPVSVFAFLSGEFAEGESLVGRSFLLTTRA